MYTGLLWKANEHSPKHSNNVMHLVFQSVLVWSAVNLGGPAASFVEGQKSLICSFLGICKYKNKLTALRWLRHIRLWHVHRRLRDWGPKF